MRVFRLSVGNETRYATEAGDEFEILNGHPFGELTPTGRVVSCREVRVLPPVTPNKIIGVGANFPGDTGPSDLVPSVFLMPPTALIGPGARAKIPAEFGSILAEGELGVVIGKQISKTAKLVPGSAILGYTCVNDFSLRDSSLDYVPPLIKKGADSMVAVGPCIHLGNLVDDASIQTFCGSERVQEGLVSQMKFSVDAVITFLTRYITLEPGDLISMGTPVPKPRLLRGARVAVEIDGIGRLENSIE